MAHKVNGKLVRLGPIFAAMQTGDLCVLAIFLDGGFKIIATAILGKDGATWFEATDHRVIVPGLYFVQSCNRIFPEVWRFRSGAWTTQEYALKNPLALTDRTSGQSVHQRTDVRATKV